MTRRTKKIGKIVTVAAAEEREHGQQTGRSQQALNQQLDRLGELNAFRHTYSSKGPSESGKTSVSSVRWKDYQTFLHRLDHAVVSQQQIIRDCEKKLESHRRRWMLKRQKLESLERVLEKSRDKDAAFESRLEQKQLDELPAAPSPFMKSDYD